MDTNPTPHQTNTTAFFVQAALSFGIALLGLIWAIWSLPLDPWARGFLAMTSLFLVSSCFSLAKVIRDHQESQYLAARVDQARVEKLLAEHDPFRGAA